MWRALASKYLTRLCQKCFYFVWFFYGEWGLFGKCAGEATLPALNIAQLWRQRAGCGCAVCCETARSRVASTCVSRDNALAAGVSGSVRTAEPLGSVVRSWTVVFLFCACPAEHCTLLESPNFRIRRHLDSPNLHHIRRQRAGCGCAGNSTLSSRFDLRIRR